ncbi:hypothetical protein BDW71DRAFT_134468 [Aspergillus fruticulosus]
MNDYKRFNLEDLKNGELTDEYRIINGMKYHKAMTRSCYEQQRRMNGILDWEENKDSVTEFTQQGLNDLRAWRLYTRWEWQRTRIVDPTSLTSTQPEDIIHIQQRMLRTMSQCHWRTYLRLGCFAKLVYLAYVVPSSLTGSKKLASTGKLGRMSWSWLLLRQMILVAISEQSLWLTKQREPQEPEYTTALATSAA